MKWEWMTMTEPMGSLLDPEPGATTNTIEVIDHTRPAPEPRSHPLVIAVVTIAAGIAVGVGLWRAIRKWRYVYEQARRKGPQYGPYRTSDYTN
jgi:hypothetical protein